MPKRANTTPGFVRMVGRALARRCPRCGGRSGWFTGWYQRVDRCRTCGYKYERAPGFVLGEVTINTIVTFGLLAVVITAGILLTYPEVPLVPLTVAAVAVAVVVPIVFYPYSSLLWAAVDLKMHPLDAAAVADAEAHAAGAEPPDAGAEPLAAGERPGATSPPPAEDA